MGEIAEIKKPIERRHWISVPSLEGVSENSGEEPTKGDKLTDKKLMDLGFLWNISSGSTDFVFKTWDEEEAKHIVEEAGKILDKSESGFDAGSVSHVLQPQCPKCRELARFADFHCSECGAELLEKEYCN